MVEYDDGSAVEKQNGQQAGGECGDGVIQQVQGGEYGHEINRHGQGDGPPPVDEDGF